MSEAPEAAVAIENDVMQRLKPLLVAHNRAALMGATIGLVLGVSSIIGAVVMVANSRLLAGFLFAFALIAIGQALRLHRQVLHDTGRGRRHGARLIVALEKAGGAMTLEEAESAFGHDDLLSALAFAGQLGIVYATAESGVDRLVLVPDRFSGRVRISIEG
jgi:hypothetical protein